jgi:hypothetical protein
MSYGNFRYVRYDAHFDEPVALGSVTEAEAFALLRDHPWREELDRVHPNAVQAPGLEFTDPKGRVLYLGFMNQDEYMLAYTRPSVRRRFTLLGWKEKFEPQYYSELDVKGMEKVERVLADLFAGRTEALDKLFR